MIKCEIQGQKLHLTQPLIVAGSIDYLTASFRFSPDWAGLAKVAHFAQGDVVYDVILDERDQITEGMHLNLGTGEWAVYLHGNVTEDGELIQRITTNSVTLKVKENDKLDGDPLPEIPASVSEQILAKAQSAEDKAEAVKADADAAEQRAADARLSAAAAEAGAEAAAEAASDALGAARIAQGAAQDAQVSAASAEASAGGAVSTAEEAMRKAQSVVDAAERGDFNGKPGSDAEVTEDNIKRALGFEPADAENVPTKEDLSDLSDNVIKGVKIAGTALEKDADGNVNFALGGGLYRTSANGIGISIADQAAINNRTSQRPLAASCINQITEAALTDSRRMQLTDEQKDTACDTLGAVREKPWVLLNEITLNEDKTSFEIKSDSAGNAYNLSNVIVNFDFIATHNGYVYANVLDEQRYRISVKTGSQRYATYEAEANGMFCKQKASNGNYVNYLTSHNNTAVIPISTYIQRILFEVYQDVAIPSGTKITIYGVRA